MNKFSCMIFVMREKIGGRRQETGGRIIQDFVVHCIQFNIQHLTFNILYLLSNLYILYLLLHLLYGRKYSFK